MLCIFEWLRCGDAKFVCLLFSAMFSGLVCRLVLSDEMFVTQFAKYVITRRVRYQEIFQCYHNSNLILSSRLRKFSFSCLPRKHQPSFSNSFIIHEEKTRKLLPWRRFGYVILTIVKFSDLLLWFSIRIINALRSYIKHSKVCFIRYQNTSKLVKKTRPRLFLETHFSVFGYPMKHSSECLIYYFRM